MIKNNKNVFNLVVKEWLVVRKVIKINVMNVQIKIIISNIIKMFLQAFKNLMVDVVKMVLNMILMLKLVFLYLKIVKNMILLVIVFHVLMVIIKVI